MAPNRVECISFPQPSAFACNQRVEITQWANTTRAAKRSSHLTLPPISSRHSPFTFVNSSRLFQTWRVIEWVSMCIFPNPSISTTTLLPIRITILLQSNRNSLSLCADCWSVNWHILVLHPTLPIKIAMMRTQIGRMSDWEVEFEVDVGCGKRMFWPSTANSLGWFDQHSPVISTTHFHLAILAVLVCPSLMLQYMLRFSAASKQRQQWEERQNEFEKKNKEIERRKIADGVQLTTNIRVKCC